MAVVIESITKSAGSDTNQCVVSMPATRPDDDLYLFMLCKDDTNTVTNPTGLNQIVNGAADPGFTAAVYFGWRIGNSEPSSYTFAHGGGTEDFNAAVLRCSGFKTADPIGATTNLPGDAVLGSGNPTNNWPTGSGDVAEEAGSLILRLFWGDGITITSYNCGS